MNYNSWSGKRHVAPALCADIAAARTAALAIYPGQTNFRYKAIYFNATGTLDVYDANGAVVSVTGAIGSIYPVDNLGVQTGGNTTLAQGQFILIFD